MKRSKLFLSLALILSLCIAFSSSAFATAPTQDAISIELERIQASIQKFEVPGVTVFIDYAKVNDENLEFAHNLSDEELDEYIQSIYTDASNISYEMVDVPPASTPSITPYVIDPPYTTYPRRTGRVNSTIPSIGVCTIEIIFSSTLSSDKYFVDGYVIGSQQVGLALGQWSHTYGEFNIAQYQTYASVVAHGTLTYGVPGTSVGVSTSQSFEYIDSYRNY